MPGLGDFVTAGVSLLLLVAASRQRVPGTIIGRMLLNILLDLAIGAVPFFGDIGDAVFKSNQRNLELLKRHAHGIEPPRTIDRIVVLSAALFVIVIAGLGIWLSWQILRWVLDRPF